MAIYHIKIYSKETITYVGHYNLDSLTHDNYGGGTYAWKETGMKKIFFMQANQ